MLLQMVRGKIEAIQAIDVDRDAMVFAQQILAHNPAPFQAMPPTLSVALAGEEPAGRPVNELGALLLARCLLGLIKEIPDHATELHALAVDRFTSPHIRAAVLGALAYLVQPAELIHDEAPGGYGYVDDCIVLKTMRLAMARMGVPVALDEGRELRTLSLLALALSPRDFARMQNLMTRTWNEIHLLHMLPPHVAAAQAERIESRPLDLPYDWSTPTPTPAFTSGSPSLTPGAFANANPDGITIDFAGGGMVHMTPTGDIFGYD